VAADALGADGRLVVRFTEQVVIDATPDDQTFGEMRERFTVAEIVQLLLVIGNYMMVGRVMATAQLEVDAVLGDDVLANVEASRRRANAAG
jgi:4-carboxymuconolactone decarboxylase